MAKTIEIGYLSSTDRDYSQALQKVKSLEELKSLVQFYSPLTDDAIKTVEQMSEKDFEDYKQDAKKVKSAKGKSAERIVKRWGNIFMPELMMKVSMTAMHFGAPFGTAFIRMKEMGKL